jgi:protocatechuate 3,4-dioxygenase beta subunit
VRRAAILAVILAAGCGGDSSRPKAAEKHTCTPTHGAREAIDRAASGTASRVRLGPGMELKATKRNLAAGRVGTPLVVTGTVRGEDCTPLEGATVHVWQTNGKGRYGPVTGGRDRCCYLQGTALTGEDGRYTLDTVMPRGYEGGPPHIHMQAGHPDRAGVVTELVFEKAVERKAFDIVLRDG